MLHPTSLPGPWGAGDIGLGARRFVQWCESAGLRIWQMLPVNPPDGSGSPYASPSAFARSPLLLSVDDLVRDGWLTRNERPFGANRGPRIDHGHLARVKGRALQRAAERVARTVDLGPWLQRHAWARDWSRFAAIVQAHGLIPDAWPAGLRHRDPEALSAFEDAHASAIQQHTALQWLFTEQWAELRAEAASRGVALWGDLPFFVGNHACDVWAHPHLFEVDVDLHPTLLTGVPPDAFSDDGQLWGTPHYRHEAHRDEDFTWWCDRLASTIELFDVVRLDHFRGVAGVWQIPRGASAKEGAWVAGLGAPLLDAIQARLGRLPLIAEDLGIITPDVEALRDDYGLPGMSILQFAFSGTPGDHPYLPHRHRENLVVFPGTHDNNTSAGWYTGASPEVQHQVRRYFATDGTDPAGTLTRAAWASTAHTAIVAMQDLLRLDGSARMNVPGQAYGAWSWRATGDAMSLELAGAIADDLRLFGRR